MHNAALNQQDLNDAFLNLWSALEVASVTDSSKSKIESVTDNIVSILQNDYFECIFSNILDDLKNNLGNRKVSLLLKDITNSIKRFVKSQALYFLKNMRNIEKIILRMSLSIIPIYVIKYITYMSKEKIAKNYGIFPKSIVKELNGIFIAYIGLEMLLFMQGKAINEYKC